MGDRHTIKEQYERLCRLLRDDLKVDPLPETSRTFETLITSL
jgi:hypothetical protein